MFYTLEGYAGRMDLLSRLKIIAFAAVLGVAGGLAGIIGTLIAYWARKKMKR
jgi:hypothetical protein